MSVFSLINLKLFRMKFLFSLCSCEKWLVVKALQLFLFSVDLDSIAVKNWLKAFDISTLFVGCYYVDWLIVGLYF